MTRTRFSATPFPKKMLMQLIGAVWAPPTLGLQLPQSPPPEIDNRFKKREDKTPAQQRDTHTLTFLRSSYFKGNDYTRSLFYLKNPYWDKTRSRKPIEARPLTTLHELGSHCLFVCFSFGILQGRVPESFVKIGLDFVDKKIFCHLGIPTERFSASFIEIGLDLAKILLI